MSTHRCMYVQTKTSLNNNERRKATIGKVRLHQPAWLLLSELRFARSADEQEKWHLKSTNKGNNWLFLIGAMALSRDLRGHTGWRRWQEVFKFIFQLHCPTLGLIVQKCAFICLEKLRNSFELDCAEVKLLRHIWGVNLKQLFVIFFSFAFCSPNRKISSTAFGR